MAHATVETAGVLGTGVQARLQLEAARLVRPFARALVWGRDPDKAAATAELARSLGIEARPEPDPARLVAESQLVVTTTPARAPILQADWLHPGLHITAMGSDQAEKNELDPRILAAADLYVCDRATQAETLGELRAALAAGLWTRGTPPSSAPSSPAPPPAARRRRHHRLRPHRHRRPGTAIAPRPRRRPRRRRRHPHVSAPTLPGRRELQGDAIKPDALPKRIAL